MPPISSRLRLLAALSQQPFVRLLLALWAATGTWDLALSEWIPEEYAKRLPRVYQVIAMTTGLLSWQIWIVVGAIILMIACLEYVFRHNGAKIILDAHGVADQIDIGATDTRYRFAIYLLIMFCGLLCVIVGATIIYGKITTEIQHPEITYLPENDVSTADIARPIPFQTPPSLPQPQLVSTAFHEVYKCQYHWEVIATPKERAVALAKIKASFKTMERAFGVSVKWHTTDDSVVVELTPVDPSNIRVFGGMVKKLTEEIRYLNDDYVVVTITYEVPGLLGQLLGLMPPPDIPGARDQQRKLAASLLQIDDDKCKLL